MPPASRTSSTLVIPPPPRPSPRPTPPPARRSLPRRRVQPVSPAPACTAEHQLEAQADEPTDGNAVPVAAPSRGPEQGERAHEEQQRQHQADGVHGEDRGYTVGGWRAVAFVGPGARRVQPVLLLLRPLADHQEDPRATLELRGPLAPRPVRPAEREGVPLDLVDPRPGLFLPTQLGHEIEVLRVLGGIELELELERTDGGRGPLVSLHHEFLPLDALSL